MKYRAVATITWDFDVSPRSSGALSPKEIQEAAQQHLGQIPIQDGISDLRLILKIDKIRQKIEKVRVGEFKIEEVIPFITKEETKRDYTCDGVVHSVKMNSPRYFIFRECMNCVCCGLQSTKVFLEYHPADKSPHFNFYGEEDGQLVLFTKDHIHAKSFGGEDRHSNYQTMCLTCNNLKSHSNLTLDNLRILRQVLDDNKKSVTKKKLHTLLEETRNTLAKPWPNRNNRSKRKKVPDAVITNCDIHLYRTPTEIYGKSIYDAPTTDARIGCIRKGTCLEPLVAMKNKVMCKFQDDEVMILDCGLLRNRD